MPLSRANNTYVQNAFNKGLITEATGLTFPENACTDTDNCVFSRLGRVTRRLGIDFEAHNTTVASIDRASKAVTTFKWDNAGGDGNTKVLVKQVGATLYFYRSSSATIASPLSSTKLASTVTISSFIPIWRQFRLNFRVYICIRPGVSVRLPPFLRSLLLHLRIRDSYRRSCNSIYKRLCRCSRSCEPRLQTILPVKRS
jgi:hypothetical protein